LIDNKINFLYF